MSLINLENESDPWIFEHDSCSRLQKEILEQFDLRNRERKYSDKYSRLSANIRIRLKQYNTEVDQLNLKNEQAFQRRTITSQEYERRLRQIESLQSKYIKMITLFNDQNKSDDRSKLLAPESSRGNRSSVQDLGTVDWGVDDDDVPPISSLSAPNYSINDVRQSQQQLMSEQDRGLEELSNVIARQKKIAETIHTEVEIQNDLIDELGDNMERTNDRIRNETRNVQIIDRKESTCGYWTIIILLFIGILLVAFLP